MCVVWVEGGLIAEEAQAAGLAVCWPWLWGERGGGGAAWATQRPRPGLRARPLLHTQSPGEWPPASAVVAGRPGR